MTGSAPFPVFPAYPCRLRFSLKSAASDRTSESHNEARMRRNAGSCSPHAGPGVPPPPRGADRRRADPPGDGGRGAPSKGRDDFAGRSSALSSPSIAGAVMAAKAQGRVEPRGPPR